MSKHALRILLLACALSPASAFAHAHLLKAEPSENSVLKKAPAEIVLSFSEPLEAAMSKVEVMDSGGNPVATGPLTPDASDPRTIRASLEVAKATKATYKIKWKAVSKDAHKMLGGFEFTVDPNSK